MTSELSREGTLRICEALVEHAISVARGRCKCRVCKEDDGGDPGVIIHLDQCPVGNAKHYMWRDEYGK